jgi:hypothetical protein
MRLTLLVAAAVVLPFAWGWAVYWLIERVWPFRPRIVQTPVEPSPPSADFQI